MADYDWLSALCSADDVEPHEAAALMIECGIQLTRKDWCELGTAGRAAYIVAVRNAKVKALAEAGRDLDAAREYAQIDGGVQAARLMAQAAMHGVANAMRQQKKGQP